MKTAHGETLMQPALVGGVGVAGAGVVVGIGMIGRLIAAVLLGRRSRDGKHVDPVAGTHLEISLSG